MIFVTRWHIGGYVPIADCTDFVDRPWKVRGPGAPLVANIARGKARPLAL
jgi:hypothetical protein